MAGHIMRNAILTVNAVAYASGTCKKAVLTPDTPSQQYRTLAPAGVIVDTDSTVWTLELAGLSDWETGGLARYCNDNNGVVTACTLAPKAGATFRLATFSVVLQPVAFGGEQGAWAEFELKLPVIGQPVFSSQP